MDKGGRVKKSENFADIISESCLVEEGENTRASFCSLVIDVLEDGQCSAAAAVRSFQEVNFSFFLFFLCVPFISFFRCLVTRRRYMRVRRRAGLGKTSYKLLGRRRRRRVLRDGKLFRGGLPMSKKTLHSRACVKIWRTAGDRRKLKKWRG